MNDDDSGKRIPTHLEDCAAIENVGVAQRHLTAICSTTREQWDYELWPL